MKINCKQCGLESEFWDTWMGLCEDCRAAKKRVEATKKKPMSMLDIFQEFIEGEK